jgi:hypothetical protein
LRIARLVQVLGVQHRVAPGEPGRGPRVQLAAARLDERGVDALADQGVREEIAVALGPQEEPADRLVAGVVLLAEDHAQLGQVEALPEDGGRLQRPTVPWWEHVHAREHDAPDGAGHDAPGRRLVGRAQELLEEERVAAGPLDASLGEPRGRVDERRRQRQRLVAPERRQVDRRQRHAGCAGAPGRIDRVALDPGGQDQQRRALARGGG